MHCFVEDIEERMPLPEFFGWLAKSSIDAKRREQAEKRSGGR